MERSKRTIELQIREAGKLYPLRITVELADDSDDWRRLEEAQDAIEGRLRSISHIVPGGRVEHVRVYDYVEADDTAVTAALPDTQ